MPPCVIECSDVFDERRFMSQTIGILRALLTSTATTNNQLTILYDIDPETGEYIPFYRLITIECDGEIVVTDFTLDMEPYTPTGTIVPTEPIATSATLVSHSAEVVGDTTIAAGFVEGTFAVVSGTADFNGVTYPEGSSLNLFPMSFGSTEQLYPAMAITNVTGTVNVYYITKV